MKLPITKPWFDEEDFKAVVEPLKSGWVVQGPKVRDFENAVAAYCGTKYAVATSNCTTALHLGLLASGVGRGDEVIVPAFTYIATANAVEYCGATVRFCDIDLKTFNIDPDSIEAVLTDRTKAIIPVSLFGLPADLPRIAAICKKKGLILFEDAACAIGARIDGVHCGNWGIGGAFSFHPRKAISTGEGGMLTTNDQAIAEQIRILRDHGAEKSDLSRHKEKGGSLLPNFDVRGYNYRMTDIQGAIGVTQMLKLDRIIAGRTRGAALYDEALVDLPFVGRPFVPTGYTHGYQSYVVLYRGASTVVPDLSDLGVVNIERNSLMSELEATGISVRQGTHAVHTLGYYSDRYSLSLEDFPNALIADRLSMTLPLFHDITADEIEYVREQLDLCYRKLQ